ncbi:hypothetical protein [Achromobacter anxifer]|uniref:hypothetical protein n=1 Tax=Achromobacter anxifer TaxID=1287737 RepID=UPI0021580288|nr:hypothetical protein [Achromobacter anxifer]
MKSASAPGTAKPARARKQPEDNAKILPTRSPVDVPRLPAKPDASTPDEAARDKRIVADTRTESNWADGSAPQPNAKNARSSLF